MAAVLGTRVHNCVSIYNISHGGKLWESFPLGTIISYYTICPIMVGGAFSYLKMWFYDRQVVYCLKILTGFDCNMMSISGY